MALLITFTLGCLFVAPLAPEAQPPTHVHRIGGLVGTTPEGDSFVEAFLEGMRALGYVEGQNLVMESRGAEGQHERLPALAAELVGLPVDVLVTWGTPAAVAAKHATTTIPIVIVSVGDPVGTGLVASLARPGGNITGLSVLSPELVGKQLEILKEALPTVSRVAILWNPANPANALQVRAADVAAQPLGVQLHLVAARGDVWGQDPEGCQARRPAGGAVSKVRAGHQPEDGRGARPHHSPLPSLPGDRGDPLSRDT
jgi:putative ABC transport system substrate-binding protein